MDEPTFKGSMMKIPSVNRLSLGLIGALLMALTSPAWALTLIEVAKLTASDAATEDRFGHVVAIDGDTALIGAFGDDDNGYYSGSVYVFTKSGGVWTEQAKLTASDGDEGEYFGLAVALDGDTALIGASYDDDKGRFSGSAYVFTRNAGVWTEQAKLTASDGSSGDRFGDSVALDGDTALIGAYYDDDKGGQSGSAYVFSRKVGVWTEQTKLTASDGSSSDGFGHSVALAGDTALIGSRGSVYVFSRRADLWTEQTKLIASDGASDDSFGSSVALYGDTALIGAIFDDDNGISSGSAYAFNRKAGIWAEQAKLTATDGAMSDYFGASVAVDGDIVLIGAYGDIDKDSSGGSVYVFTRSGEVWTEQTKLTASDTGGDDYFGHSVALDGDTALIGAPFRGDNGRNSGSAYIFPLRFEVVTIDIDPGSPANSIDPNSNGLVAVAILTDDDFDALQVDPEAAKFATNEVTAERYTVTDVDRDGDQDLLLYFSIAKSGFACSDTQAELAGELYNETKITGRDSVTTVRCIPKTVIEAESMALTDGYGVENIPAASGGELIRRLDAGSYPALASTAFVGRAGIYNIEVAYYDELDGRSSLAFLLNGELLDHWIADEDPACRYCAMPNERTLRTRVVAKDIRLSPGDELTLQGTADVYEYARFDNITLSPAGFSTLEAEMMTLSGGYAVEDNAEASGGQIIRRLNSGGYPALASNAYAGRAGIYDIEVAYFDERDGRSSLALLLNGELLDAWIADEDPTCRDCASPNERTLRSRVVARDVSLSPGDELALQGTGDYYEYARFDNIALSPAGFNTLEAEDMTLDDGFVVEANAAASGGLIIRGNGPADATPGQASAAFMGSEGQYDITVTYFDEYDGISSMAMFLNNQLLEQWLADEDPTCRDCASPNERTLRSRAVATGLELFPGDEIRLESTVNQYEYGRFDKIDFTPSLSP